ncbi:hypothetical protein SDC9_168739 [bioreactor metagenome]|uniref:Uncharacterized protein n=1 Tax=bioreactor metagenome TaxID=1076179 RepID=A0A645G5Z9_9ZZZZ
MLRDAHRIEDGGVLRSAVQARRLDDRLRGHARDLPRVFGGVSFDRGPERLKILDARRDKGLVVKPFL